MRGAGCILLLLSAASLSLVLGFRPREGCGLHPVVLVWYIITELGLPSP